MLYVVGIVVVVVILLRVFFPQFLIGARKEIEKREGTYENSMELSLRKTDSNIQIAYVYLAGWLMRKNSQQSREKVKFVHTYFKHHFQKVDVEIAAEMTNALKYTTNIRSISKWVIKYMSEGRERLDLIDFLFDLALVDGEMIDREFVAIARFSELVGVRASYLEKKLQEFHQERFRFKNAKSPANSQKAQFLRILQLTEPFTQEQLKRSYRKLAVKYHPDKFHNASEAEQEEAEKQFLELQKAYEFFCN